MQTIEGIRTLVTSETAVRVTWHSEHLAEMVIDNPPLNVLSGTVQDELREHVSRLHEQSDLRCLLVSAAGERAFSVGADIKEQVHDADPDPWRGVSLSDHWTGLLETLHCLTICCIRGYCLGGGLELALCCDMRIASPDARFGLPEVKLGLLPGMGGTVRLPRLIGPSAAKVMMMTGRQVASDEALSLALVDEVVDDPAARATEIANRLMDVAPLAQREIKALVTSSLHASYFEAERATWRRLRKTADASEGMAAFQQRRSPKFIGS